MRYFFLLALLALNCKESATHKIPTPPQQRPNIVYIMADDHAKQAISAYGHVISQMAPTPNIDRIAAEGVLFENNFCTNSICGPSRAVVLTGKFSHKNGFRKNGDKFDGSQQTFPKLLQKAGYNTAIIGKWHLHDLPQGFNYWNILKDQGHYYNPDFISINPQTQVADTVRTHGYATDIITNRALGYLQQAKNSTKPFMLMVHHKAPHRNWMPALRHLNKFDSITFPLPESYFTTHKGSLGSQEQLQTIYKNMYEGYDLKLTVAKGSSELVNTPWSTDFDRMSPEQRKAWNTAYQHKNDAFHEANLSGKALAEWKGQRYLKEYLATIASVDEGVGQILDYLKESGLENNTIVIYTTDQGFYLGEKGWFDKRYMYEQSLAMPLLMKYPNNIKPGSVIKGLTQNIDFAETFLDYANVPIPADMQGKSLKPLIEGRVKDEDFRNAVYYHYYDFPAFHMVKKHEGVRTKRYKLMHFYDDIDTWELYDLQEDPNEIHNQINNPDYDMVEAEMRNILTQLHEQYGITSNEFELAPQKQIDKAYENFKKMRGQGVSYSPLLNKDTPLKN